jgi:hypothetical protein
VLLGDSLVSQPGGQGRIGDDKDAVKPVFLSVDVTVPSVFVFIFTFLRSGFWNEYLVYEKSTVSLRVV